MKVLEGKYKSNSSRATVLMAHITFEEEEVESDVINLWFGKYNGIRYMANRLAKNGLDEW